MSMTSNLQRINIGDLHKNQYARLAQQTAEAEAESSSTAADQTAEVTKLTNAAKKRNNKDSCGDHGGGCNAKRFQLYMRSKR